MISFVFKENILIENKINYLLDNLYNELQTLYNSSVDNHNDLQELTYLFSLLEDLKNLNNHNKIDQEDKDLINELYDVYSKENE